MPSTIDRENDGGNSPLNVPEADQVKAMEDAGMYPPEEPSNDGSLKLEDTVEDTRLNFIPLWMPIAAFGLIAASYIYCEVAGIAVNEIRRAGVVAISGAFAIASVYLHKPRSK